MFKLSVKIIISLFAIWLLGLIVFIVFSSGFKNDYLYIENSIVLTGGNSRISESINLLEKGATSKVFLSGVNKNVNKEDILEDSFDKYKDHFFLGYKAEDTRGNVIESEEWLLNNHIKEVRVITSDYHLLRAKVEFKRSLPGIKKVWYGVNTIDENFFNSLENWKLLCGEYNKFIYVLFNYGVLS
ncbi:MAG: YdcF family protein [Alphaproteobacteria bacterium]|nr:YdcF family protein [Alphaproteobacteria bacterium]